MNLESDLERRLECACAKSVRFIDSRMRIDENFSPEDESVEEIFGSEVRPILRQLRRLNELGFLTVDFQPAIYDYGGDHAIAENRSLSHRFQRAYVSGLMCTKTYDKLMGGINKTRETTKNVMILVQHAKTSLPSFFCDDVSKKESFAKFISAPIDEPTPSERTYEDRFERIFKLNEEDVKTLKFVTVIDAANLRADHQADAFWSALELALL